MIRSLVTQTTRLRRGGVKYRHFSSSVGTTKRNVIASGLTTTTTTKSNRYLCCRPLSSSSSSSTTTTPCTTTDPLPSSTSSVSTTLALATAFSLLLVAGNAASITLAQEGKTSSESEEEDRMYADWDEFMIKSISPGEDDDDDDDDDDDGDEEDEDEEEEEEEEDDDDTASGPADETEDATNGGDPIVVTDDDDDDDDDVTDNNEHADDNNNNDLNTVASTKEEQPQGPADVDEDVGLGYEAATKSEQEEQEEDMYKHLENEQVEDEPTTCTICLINRQGPCRPLWRKFEHCMKDHGSNSDNDDGDNKDASPVGGGGGGTLAQMCDKYMLPWLHCIQNHRNTYTLITNSFYKVEFVDPMELAVKEENKVLFTEGEHDSEDTNKIDVDLTHWWEYVEAKREKANEHILITHDNESESVEDEEKRLEKEMLEMAEQEAKEFLKDKGIEDEPTTTTVPKEEDPFLVNVYAKFNLRDPSNTNRIIDIAYIRDQDGRLLGFDQFTKEKTPPSSPGESEENKEEISSGGGGGGGDENVHVEDEKDNSGGKTGNCMFHIRPGETTSIQLFALYREGNNNKNEGEGVVVDGEDDEVKSGTKVVVEETLYYSAPISLEERPPTE